MLATASFKAGQHFRPSVPRQSPPSEPHNPAGQQVSRLMLPSLSRRLMCDAPGQRIVGVRQ
jgi:hypothetical protein